MLFASFWANVEFHSTVLFAVPGPMSSYTWLCFLLYQVQCRVTLNSAFSYTRSNVELNSTVFSAVPGPVTYTRQYFLLYQAQCRITLDSAFRRTRPNVELKYTSYFTMFFFFPLCFYFFITALNLENFRLFGEFIWKGLSKCIRINWTVRCYGHTFQ
jgi:hypothetical protein